MHPVNNTSDKLERQSERMPRQVGKGASALSELDSRRKANDEYEQFVDDFQRAFYKEKRHLPNWCRIIHRKMIRLFNIKL